MAEWLSYMKIKGRDMTQLEEAEIVEILALETLGEIKVRKHFGLDDKQRTLIMLNNGYEKCTKCGWFVECGELVNEEGEADGLCTDCRRYG